MNRVGDDETMSVVIERVADRFALGPVVTTPVRVPGGLSNDLWRIRTENGTFAVKRMVVNADRFEFVDNVEAAFRVEAQAFAAGVPMPAPVPDPGSGRALVRISNALVRVHTWVENVGGVGSPGQAGALLGTIHAAGSGRWAPRVSAMWEARGWSDELAALARRVAGGPDRVVEVDSHRDLDIKNTLRRHPDGLLAAVDWDAAGPVGAVHEAIGVAVDWSDMNPVAFRATIDAYEAVMSIEIPAEPWVFAGWVAAQGGWLDYNAAHRAGTKLGDAEVTGTLERLSRLADNLDLLLDGLV